MALWWPGAISGYDDDGRWIPNSILVWEHKPRGEWFWAPIPHYAWGWPGARTAPTVDTYYWFYIIVAANGHKRQLAIKSPVDRQETVDGDFKVKANVIYLLTYPDDTPNWGNVSGSVTISPPCANWQSNVYTISDAVTRSQTTGVMAAVRANRDKASKIKAAIAKIDSLNCAVECAIAGNPELDVSIQAAIMGERERSLPIRAAIRAERLLEPAIVAAVAHDFDLPAAVSAAISGDTQRECRISAGIKGEAEKTVGITAFIVKSRVDKIMLEMENLWPQELDLRSTPNWASKFKDYRKSSLGE